MAQAIFAAATSSVAVTPSDSTVLDFRALHIGVGGDVAIKHTASSTSVVYKNLPSGFPLNVNGGIVMATGTTATDIVAMNW